MGDRGEIMRDLINKFREQRGKNSVQNWDNLVSYNCKMHCLAMSREKKLYHAPSYFLEDWKEGVASCSYSDNWKERIIYDAFDKDDEHRSILLDSSTLSVDCHIENWVVYVCIRGK